MVSVYFPMYCREPVLREGTRTMREKNPIRVGISGTGFIARGLVKVLLSNPTRYQVSIVLTRRNPETVSELPGNPVITNSIARLTEQSDIIVECSGTVEGARQVVVAAVDANIPVVTMNAEFQLTLGAAFGGSEMVTEDQGDQPGSLAALDEEVRLMGFTPLLYGSQKGFLNHNPSKADMEYWSKKQGISLSAVTSFTDGTKVQIEQALVANALGGGIIHQGLSGPKSDTLAEAGELLARQAKEYGQPISDYALCPTGRGEVFIVATHASPPEQLQYYKLGNGEHYLIERPYHLGHFEIPITLERMLSGRGPLLSTKGNPRISVAAIAKRDLRKGTSVPKAVGSFDFRGEAVRINDEPNHVPIGLLEDCVLSENIEEGEMVTWNSVVFKHTKSINLWRTLTSETRNDLGTRSSRPVSDVESV